MGCSFSEVVPAHLQDKVLTSLGHGRREQAEPEKPGFKLDAPSYIRMNKLYAQSSWYVADDGSDIYTVFFKAHPPSRGVIVYHHGLACHSHWGEDIQAKRSLFEPLQQARFHVYTYDARGHGRTGVANDNLGSARLDELTEDFYTAVHDMVSAYPALPIYVMGHSLGDEPGD